MKIRILWVGKTKERYLAEGIDRYLKLLSHMARVSVLEIKEEKGKERTASLSGEGGKILKQTQSYFLLDARGRAYSSEEFSMFLKDRTGVDFVIGGPYGVSDEVRDRALGVISLSRMTFTHDMARLVLLEQVYRGMTIMKGMEYHH